MASLTRYPLPVSARLRRPRRSLLSPRVSGFPTATGQAAYSRAYERTVGALWPVPVEHAYLPTRFGTTHVLLGGPSDGSPVVLPRRFPDADIRRITTPTSLLIAEREVLYAPRAALRRAQHLFPNLVDAALVPGAGHLVTLAAPDLINDEILRCLTTPATSQGGRP